jgi:hypothetical protein
MLIYSPGKIARQTQHFTRGPSFTILPAYTIDGFITWMIAQGGINQSRFNEFMKKQVIPLCNSYPGFRTVIVLDNSPVHKSQVSRKE